MASAPASSLRQIQLAVSASIFRDGKILIVRRAKPPAKGLYSLPGGRVEFGETLHQALHREIREETALEVEIIGLAGWREILPAPGNNGHYLILSFASRWIAGTPHLNDELDDFSWVAPAEISAFSTTEGLEDIIRAAENLLR